MSGQSIFTVLAPIPFPLPAPFITGRFTVYGLPKSLSASCILPEAKSSFTLELLTLSFSKMTSLIQKTSKSYLPESLRSSPTSPS
ncbi:MAG: hypothetical protein V2A53_06175 [bacterium]